MEGIYAVLLTLLACIAAMGFILPNQQDQNDLEWIKDEQDFNYEICQDGNCITEIWNDEEMYDEGQSDKEVDEGSQGSSQKYADTRSGGLGIAKRSILDELEKAKRNLREGKCQNGLVYRHGCHVCFCSLNATSAGKVQCVSKHTGQDCKLLTRMSHCNPSRLLYDYKERCEGDCTCNDAKNITTCDRLPCGRILKLYKRFLKDPNADLSPPKPPATESSGSKPKEKEEEGLDLNDWGV